MDNPGDTLGFKTPGGFDAVHPEHGYIHRITSGPSSRESSKTPSREPCLICCLYLGLTYDKLDKFLAHDLIVGEHNLDLDHAFVRCSSISHTVLAQPCGSSGI
jgi:hypothetical protein